MNKHKQSEQSAISDALAEMQRKRITVYKHAGVEFARVPGAEKLRVRLTKDQGDAGEADLEGAGAGPEESETGEGSRGNGAERAEA